MTAGHCVQDEAACANVKFVFGFGIKKEGVLPEKVAPSEVYKCAKIVAQTLEGEGADYALIQLDRKVSKHKVLEIDRTNSIANGDAIYVIGHPSGLPTKVA
ncbi:MAG TPA: serine protease, partial [Elusimicrobia bacterium]|nr:serine protease [Elusimicrobiota bacterium]